MDCEGRTLWIVDAHRDDGKRFVVHADEKLTAFLELQAAICACGEFVAKVVEPRGHVRRVPIQEVGAARLYSMRTMNVI